MAMILLAVFLIAEGLTRIFSQLATPTIRVVIAIIAIIAGVLMLLGR